MWIHKDCTNQNLKSESKKCLFVGHLLVPTVNAFLSHFHSYILHNGHQTSPFNTCGFIKIVQIWIWKVNLKNYICWPPPRANSKCFSFTLALLHLAHQTSPFNMCQFREVIKQCGYEVQENSMQILLSILGHFRCVGMTPSPFRIFPNFPPIHSKYCTSHLCDLTFKSDTGQHAQFLQCLSDNKGIGDAGSTADLRMLWSAIVCLGLGLL